MTNSNLNIDFYHSTLTEKSIEPLNYSTEAIKVTCVHLVVVSISVCDIHHAINVSLILGY